VNPRSSGRIRIGLIHPRYVVDNHDETHQWHSFVLSAGEVSERAILDSQSASPGRYMAELVHRITEGTPGSKDALLIFNPLLLLQPAHLCAVLAWLDDCSPQSNISVIEDRGGYPLAYRFPSWIADDIRFLLLLSGTSGQLDQRLLTAAFGNTRRSTLDFKVVALTCGFAAGAHLRPGEWMTEHACRVLESAAAILSSASPNAQAQLRAQFVFSAFMPHHAGDVLLFGLASRHAPDWFKECVINSAFVDVFRASGSPLTVQAIDGPAPYRNDNPTDDPGYFAQICGQLRNDRLYVYLRTTRYAATTDFHLLDHFAFALGRSYRHQADLLAHLPTPCRMEIPAAGRIRVLLHFDAGWHLKRYPEAYQHRLVEALTRLDIKVTVMDAASSELRCARTAFTTLASFRDLLDDQQLFIGMDSFPAHYAAHIAGMPTLLLFSNTHAINHAPPGGDRCQHLDAGLDCSPCLARDACPRFGGSVCRNFAAPEAVVSTASRLLAGRQQKAATPGQGIPSGTTRAVPVPSAPPRHLPSMEQPGYLRPGTAHLRISAASGWRGKLLNRLHCRALEAVGPLLKLVWLGREYLRCCTSHGPWLGNSLLKAYLAKSFRDSRARK